MKITFLGVGTAVDKKSTTSILIEGKANILFDCGYGMIYNFWNYNTNPDFLDAIYLSHGHGDHLLGAPAIIIMLFEEIKRKKPLYIITQPYVFRNLMNILKKVFPATHKNFAKKIKFIKAKNMNFKGLKLDFARTKHSLPNFAIKITEGKKSFSYSGDGMFTNATTRMYKGSNLIIQETYYLGKKEEGHAGVKETIEMAAKLKIKTALIHVSAEAKQHKARIMQIAKQKKADIFIPEPMRQIKLEEELIEPELRPEYKEKLLKIEKEGKFIKFKSISDLRRKIENA